MPSPEKFLSSFGLITGYRFGDYILIQSNITHEIIKRYQEYQYDIELLFSNTENGTWTNLFNVISDVISHEHTVKGVRNQYKCIIDYPVYGNVYSENNNIRIFLTGHAYRL